MGIAGAGIQAFGDIASGYKQSATDQHNADIAGQNAATAGLQGGLQEYATGLKTADAVGTQKVVLAAHNVNEASPTAQNIVAGTRKAGMLDQSALQFTTANKVNADNYQASVDKNNASAALIGGYLSAASTMLGAGASASGNSIAMQRFAVPSAGPGYSGGGGIAGGANFGVAATGGGWLGGLY